ncbi:uncharacterized protein LOC134446713 isoform X2 [Engraulis encrasicolus]|uniref:uncharacterized protein LOC134446713 isoform X2 n=1 Tax=Engraulis encrasicolus TaxID=184585 RepID=UPI002FD660E8
MSIQQKAFCFIKSLFVLNSMDKDCVAPDGHNRNGQPESVTGSWEDGKQCSGNEYLETERNTDQLLKVSPALQPPPTNAAVNTSELPVPAEQACQQLERKRRRKMTTPRKVCTQEELDEGDLNIFQRPLFPCLKPPASHKRTAPSRRIKKARLSAVCHGQTTSSKRKDKILGCLETKQVTPSSVQATPKNHTPIIPQPQSSKKHHPTILWRKKSGSTPLLRDDRSSKITAAAHLPSGPAHFQASSPQSTRGPSTAERPADTSESPLRMHGLSVEDYRRVYHSVVDPMLCTASGNPQRPNLELGRVIKQRLWERLFCPQLHEEVGPDGRVTITETFNHPPYYTHAPHVELDMSTYPNTQTGGEKEKHTKQETSD